MNSDRATPSRAYYKNVLAALAMREFATVSASRVAWVFAAGCLGFGLAVGLGGSSAGSTAVWLVLPLVLYFVPLLGLLLGVSATRGDMPEEVLINPRFPSIFLRLLVKWAVWMVLLGLVILAWIFPAVIRAGEVESLPALWSYTLGETAVFIAMGLALGRLLRDGVTAHLAALLAGFVFIAGAGILGWIAAQSTFFQQHSSLWTLGLMLHPVEALRVSLMFSLENLPFDRGHLPPLAAWWLDRPGLWYAAIAAAWSALALVLGSIRGPISDSL